LIATDTCNTKQEQKTLKIKYHVEILPVSLHTACEPLLERNRWLQGLESPTRGQHRDGDHGNLAGIEADAVWDAE